MVTYYVGPEGNEDAHSVDHPPLFACREHKALLKLTPRFVDELLAVGADTMPGNPEEVAQAFLPQAAAAWRLPEWMVPPKIVLFNPQNLRGVEALPFAFVLIDGKRFFGVPARYLTPDRFDGCEECKQRPYRRPNTQVRRAAPGRPGPPPPPPRSPTPGAMRRPPPAPAGGSRPPSGPTKQQPPRPNG